MLHVWLIYCTMFLWALATSEKTYNHHLKIPTDRPLNIAHRGASGVLPEHTLAAYQRAIDDGADVIECDVVVSRDGHLICRHDPWLSTSTDVTNRAEFRDRKRTIVDFEYYGMKKNITDWFIVDFSLEELKTLRVHQVNQERDPSFDGKLQMATFHEHILLAKNSSRTIAIYPELKYPGWVNSLDLFNGTSYEEYFVSELTKYGYQNKDDPCILQSFEYDSVKTLANLTNLPVVMAIEYDFQATPDLLDMYAEVAYGVATWKCSFVDHYGPNGYKSSIRNVSDMVKEIHSRNMKVHVYTFRNENSNLAWDYEQDPWKEYDLYMGLGVDGYFVDFPATFDQYLDVKYRNEKQCPVNGSPGQVIPEVTFFMGLMTTMMMFII